MMALVVISYILAGFVFYFYGSYYLVLSLFARWFIYPITALVLELPNMLIVYVIHWKTYRPHPISDEHNSSTLNDQEYEQQTILEDSVTASVNSDVGVVNHFRSQRVSGNVGFV